MWQLELTGVVAIYSDHRVVIATEGSVLRLVTSLVLHLSITVKTARLVTVKISDSGCRLTLNSLDKNVRLYVHCKNWIRDVNGRTRKRRKSFNCESVLISKVNILISKSTEISGSAKNSYP